MKNLKAQASGIRLVLLLGMMLVLAGGSVDTPASAKAHGGDASLVHACVNQTNARIVIVHPLPVGSPDIDCVNAPWPLGAGWAPLDLTTWSGGGTGSLSLANLTDSVGIGTAIPTEQLEITKNFRLPNSTVAAGIIMSGGDRFIHNFGMDNFFAGVNAGNLTMTGFGGNIGVGVDALLANTTGSQNTAVGTHALKFNTTGGGNTATGGSALLLNATGGANTATGQNALRVNTTGFNNTAAGESALRFNTTGNGNTATGESALLFNTTGILNTATGGNALQQNILGDFNTAVGANSLAFNFTGSNNTAIGFEADVGFGNLTNATAIGAGALVSQSNSLVLGSGANVGIGTTSPNSALEVAGVIHSTAGGIKFPDSSIQTTAAGSGGAFFAIGPTIIYTSAKRHSAPGMGGISCAFDPNAEANCTIAVPRNGTLTNLFVLPNIVPPNGASVTVTLRVNKEDTALSVTHLEADGHTVKSNTIDSVNINQGDLMTFSFTDNSAVANDAKYVTSVEFK